MHQTGLSKLWWAHAKDVQVLKKVLRKYTQSLGLSFGNVVLVKQDLCMNLTFVWERKKCGGE